MRTGTRGSAGNPSSGPWTIVVAAIDPRIAKRIADCACELMLNVRTVRPHAIPDVLPPGHVLCVGSRVADKLPERHGPAIVIYTGAAVPDVSLARVANSHTSAIPLRDLTTRSLLRALLTVTVGADGSDAVSSLRSRPRLSGVPDAILEAVFLAPWRLRTATDLCRVGKVSRARLKEILRQAGCRHPAHLLLALRAEAFCWFARQGIERSMFEAHLGITDRSTFRRACQRAGVSVPWRQGRDRP